MLTDLLTPGTVGIDLLRGRLLLALCIKSSQWLGLGVQVLEDVNKRRGRITSRRHAGELAGLLLAATVDSVTYAKADLADTVKVLEQYGVRLLTAAEMPEYPSSCSLLTSPNPAPD